VTGCIDVAVVDYGTPHLAARCVGSLRSPLFASIELFDAKARGWSYAQSVNKSLARGTAPYVLALNADTRMLEPPDKIVSLFENDQTIAVIGPRQIDQNGRLTAAGTVGTNLKREIRFWLQPFQHHADECAEEALDVPTISGSVYFCRREVWEELGGMLETEHFLEETFLDFAVRHAGHRVVYTGQTTWEHLFNQSPVNEQWRAEVAARSRETFRQACAERGIECD
jgi:GT2 family glycosyltransferase